MSFSDMPVDIGPVYEGERIRGNQMYVELGGPKSVSILNLFALNRKKKLKMGR